MGQFASQYKKREELKTEGRTQHPMFAKEGREATEKLFLSLEEKVQGVQLGINNTDKAWGK
eukprot:790085-Karenia_brevis.AAC.1